MDPKNNSTEIITESIVKDETDVKSAKTGESVVPKSHEVRCELCGKTNARKCTKCRTVAYCGRDCQSKDWPTHKLSCKSQQQQQTEKNKDIAVYNDNDTNRTVENQTTKFGKLLSSGATQGISPTPGPSSEQPDNVNTGANLGSESTSGGENLTGIGSILSDQSILNDFSDPEIDSALKDIKNDPLNIQNYKDSEKLKRLIEKITQKLDLDAKNASTGQTVK